MSKSAINKSSEHPGVKITVNEELIDKTYNQFKDYNESADPTNKLAQRLGIANAQNHDALRYQINK